MPSLNEYRIMGHLGKDPEVKYAATGTAICNFSVATTDKHKDRDGAWQEETEWHNVVCFGKTAEFCKDYLHKGSLVLVTGKHKTQKWEDKGGKMNYKSECVANSFGGILALDGKKSGGGRQNNNNQPPTNDGLPSMDDDLPF